VPHANPVDTRVRVVNISASELSELFRSRYSERDWTGSSQIGDCNIGGRKCTVNDVIVWHVLRLQTQSEELNIHYIVGGTNIYRGWRNIVPYPRWTESNGRIRDVLSGPRRRAVVTDIPVA
jgi:hypothetical protein